MPSNHQVYSVDCQVGYVLHKVSLAISNLHDILCRPYWGLSTHGDVIKWKHFPRHWPFVQGIHRSPVYSTHKRQWPRALMFSLICTCMNVWENNREAGDLRHHRAHYDVTVMVWWLSCVLKQHTAPIIVTSQLPYDVVWATEQMSFNPLFSISYYESSHA